MCRMLRHLVLLDRLKAADHCNIARLHELSYNSRWDCKKYMPKAIHPTHLKQSKSRELFILRNARDQV